MTFLTQIKVQGIRRKREKIAKNGAIDKTAFPIQALYRESVVGSVIQASGTVEFEDGLRTGVLLGGYWCPWGGHTYPRINTKPPWGCGLVLGWVWLSLGPQFQTKFQFCRVPRMGGIKLQLLCGVRIELAVGSLPYLARYPSRSLPIPLGGTQSTLLGRRGVTNTPPPWA